MSVLKRVGRQASIYAIAGVLASLTGIISFPIFTRVLTTAQYGIMGLVDVTFKFAGTLSGMGLRPAVIKLWGEFKFGKRDGGTATLASTMLSASFLIGLLISLLFVAVLLIPERWLAGRDTWIGARPYIAMAAAVILFRNLIQMVLSITQAQEKATFRSAIMLAQRYLLMGLPVLFVAVFRWELTGFFSGVLIAEGLLFVFCIFYGLRKLEWRPHIINRPVLREALLYGLPLMGLNIPGFLTAFSDRIILSNFCSAADVGIYTAGAAMALFITEPITASLNSALIPVSMNVWAEKGPDETRENLASFLRYYALAALPLVFGVTAVAPALIGLLASEKYLAAVPIIPWVMTARLIQGTYYPFLAGYFLTKRTVWLALFMSISAMLSIGLNWFLIPKLGILGAAMASLIAYSCYVFGGGIFSQRYLKLKFPVRSLLVYIFAAVSMFCLLRLLPTFESNILVLLTKVPAGVAIYASIVLALDIEARKIARAVVDKIKSRGGR
ncbi:MAG: oligosaccharide flippase family protein [bacterium]|nr:oligosaccharide flippase family protein [bacterium]